MDTELERVAFGVVSIALGANFVNDIEASASRMAAARSAAEQLIAPLLSAGPGLAQAEANR